jgi:hypothetical protein
LLNIRAKLLARSGQFAAARRLIAEAEGLITPATSVGTRADLLEAKAEVSRLARAPNGN